MKKLSLVLLVLAIAFGSAFAADKKPAPKGAAKAPSALYDKGTISANVGLGYGQGYIVVPGYSGRYYGYGFGILGGLEYDFMKWDIADVLSLTVGGAARVGISFIESYWYDHSGVSLDIAAMGMLHFGFAKLAQQTGQDWLSKVDFYVGLGLGLSPLTPSSFIGFANTDGVSYFLSPNMAIGFEYAYLNDAYLSTIQLTFKL